MTFRADDPRRGARKTDPMTSEDAAWMNPGARSGQRYRLAMAFFYARHELTWEEAATVADIKTQSSPWRRITELVERGLLEVVGRAKTSLGAYAQTYAITPAGRKAMKRLQP